MKSGGICFFLPKTARLSIAEQTIFGGISVSLHPASMYSTETKYRKRSVKNNLKRFPSDFMFELSKEEWDILRCKISTLNRRRGKHQHHACIRCRASDDCTSTNRQTGGTTNETRTGGKTTESHWFYQTETVMPIKT